MNCSGRDDSVGERLEPCACTIKGQIPIPSVLLRAGYGELLTSSDCHFERGEEFTVREKSRFLTAQAVRNDKERVTFGTAEAVPFPQAKSKFLSTVCRDGYGAASNTRPLHSAEFLLSRSFACAVICCGRDDRGFNPCEASLWRGRE